MEQCPEEIGDLYLDVGEAYLEVGEYRSALPLLSALVVSDKYNLAVVWLRHAGRTPELERREAELQDRITTVFVISVCPLQSV